MAPEQIAFVDEAALSEMAGWAAFAEAAEIVEQASDDWHDLR